MSLNNFIFQERLYNGINGPNKIDYSGVISKHSSNLMASTLGIHLNFLYFG